MSESNRLDHLQRSFGIPGSVRFEEGEGGLTRIAVDTEAASAHMYLHGAHVSHYQPNGQAPVLYLSSRSGFEPGKPIRGGVPVIFPWFGPGAGGIMHGLVRTRAWDVEAVSAMANGVQVLLGTRASNETRTLWPHDFTARMQITIGRRLELSLRVENTSARAFSFENALHTYYAVADVRNVLVGGLKGTEYLDKNLDMRRLRETDPVIRPAGPMDRVYLNTSAPCSIEDPGLKRRIVIEKSGSQSTVVWTPWSDNVARMTDIAADEWPRFLCVETANAKENAVTLAPGEAHEMRAVVRVEPLS